MTIILKYIGTTTTEDEITVKDFSFQWIEQFWEDQGVSITGKKRNNHRGYMPVLELNFEYDEQLLSVSEKIKDTLDNFGVVQYIDDDGVIPVVPDEFEYKDEYVNQVKKKPSTLVLMGDIQGREFIVTGILCGDIDVTCGQTNVLCGG